MSVTSSFRPDLLAGRTALVTGASSGIGAGCARSLAAAGARVLLSGRDQARLASIASTIPDSEILPADLRQAGEAEALAERASALGDVDILVNSAGFGVLGGGPVMKEADLDAMFAVNVRAAMMLSGRLGAKMVVRKSGSIVTIGSIVGSLGTPNQVGYAATKGAVDAFTRALAREFGPHGVRVNAIAPGAIATDMWGGAENNPAMVAGVSDLISMRRWGSAHEVGEAAVFLASDAASYVTGEVLWVGGGMARTGDIGPRTLLGG